MNRLHNMRLDKWLWSARFFKTRALAQKEIELGRVQVNGLRVKNSKTIQVGDTVDLRLNGLPYRFIVAGLNMQRRPAVEARALYQEDEIIQKKREEIKQLNQAAGFTHGHFEGRPTKRDRRKIDQLKHNWH